MALRRLTDADIAEVARLADAARARDSADSGPIDHLDLEMRGLREKKPHPDRAAFGAFDGARLVATGCATPLGDATGFISRVYADPDWRSGGLGRMMVAELEAYLKAQGRTVSTLNFWGMRPGPQVFWLKMGYSRTGTFAIPDSAKGHVVTCSKTL